MTTQEKLNIVSQIRVLILLLEGEDSWQVEKLLQSLDKLKDSITQKGTV